MAMLVLILVLFVLAIIAPFILPNSKVSSHNRDRQV